MSKITYNSRSIRAFIGAKDFKVSREFYRTLGFEEVVLDTKMSLFKVNEQLGFYLQDYYVRHWINNSMIFLEVEDIEACYQDLLSRNLVEGFKNVRLSDIKTFDWGRELFLHDPSGILWHFGAFNS